MTDDRPSWDVVWMQTAMLIATRSRCDLSRVGAVIVTADNRAMPPAYNGPPKGIPYRGTCSLWCPRAMGGARGTDYSACESIHAEANALLRADWSQIQGATIYVSSSVCINCARLISNSGISRVFHLVRSGDEHREPDKVEEFLRAAGLTAVRMHDVSYQPDR